MIKKVLVFSRLTGSGAPQRRVDNLLQLFLSSQYKAYVVRFDNTKKNTIYDIDNQLTHISLGDLSKLNFFQKIDSLNFSPKFAKKWLENVKPDVVLIYSTIHYRAARFIKKYCKLNKIKLIFDVVEYRKLTSSISLRRFFSYNLHNFMINNYVIDKSDNVIVISKYLQSFFGKKGLKHIFYYPVTFNVGTMPRYDKKKYIDKVTFLYAGSPGGRRDLINEILVAFSSLNTLEKAKVQLFICGIDKLGLLKEGVKIQTISEIERFTKILGKISKDELYNLMINIDFTLLLKNETKIYSIAGFPTKMAESFSFGIPMLANYSGDISFYLKDKFNGFVSPSNKAKDFVEVIRKAIDSVNNNQHDLLSKNAYDTAIEKIDTRLYINSFADYIDSINI